MHAFKIWILLWLSMSLGIRLSQVWLWIDAKTTSLRIVRISSVCQLCPQTTLFLLLAHLFIREAILRSLATAVLGHQYLLQFFLWFFIAYTVFVLADLPHLVLFTRWKPWLPIKNSRIEWKRSLNLLFLVLWIARTKEDAIGIGRLLMQISLALVLEQTLLIYILLDMVAKVILVVATWRNALLHLVNQLSVHVIGISDLFQLLLRAWVLGLHLLLIRLLGLLEV